ncbi:MAG TPA: TonB-dependent receptor, partial [Tenacibaculum sp.]|nr:TonB-dependent receptor [Tenacibaculum sp.]
MKNIVGITILLINSICYSQVTFKGKVLYTNEKGNEEAVPGVSVFWLNTQIGTITNDDGTFTIPRNKANSYLIISHISFKTDTL